MTTAAAIDRLVHHSVILEVHVPSYRAEAAKKARQGPQEPRGQEPKGQEPKGQEPREQEPT